MYSYLIYVFICPVSVLWTELSEIKILIELIDWLIIIIMLHCTTRRR